MALQARHLWIGVLGMVWAIGARAQVRVGQSNLRRPLTQLQAAAGPQSTIEDELHLMSMQAGVIFAGQVLSIKQQGAASAGWVEVAFRVDEAIRGCAAGETYRLREWAGLWAGGQARYRVGQQFLMMLHAPGTSGLSSPIGGQEGVLPIVGFGAAPKPGDEFVGAGQQVVDLRWIQARLLRLAANGNALHAMHTDAVLQTPQSVGTGVTQGPVARNNLRAASTNEPAESATLQGVLSLLGAWEAQQNHAAQ